MRSIRTLFATILVLALTAGAAGAADWSSTNVQVLYGDGFKVQPPEARTIITLEHASGWTYGDNFFFFDVTEPFANDTSLYGEWHPRFSFNKIFKKEMGQGFFRDVLLATELNVENNGLPWRAYLYGVGFDFNIPHFQFFALNLFVRDDKMIRDDSTFQISPSWNLPFTLGQTNWEFRGFVDFAGAEGEGEAQTLAQPQLLVNLGSLFKQPGTLWVGVEYQYWKNKYGIDGVDENFVQLMGRWDF
jgi:nucleoside-specific outer membrane channel protein Tsx